MTAIPAWFRAVQQRAADEAPNAPAPQVQPVRYLVSCLPEGPERHRFAAQVEYRGHGRWAVARDGHCLNSDGEWDWDWEHIPPERTDEWIATHRFDLDTALELARRAAPLLTVNGFTVLDALAVQAQEDCR